MATNNGDFLQKTIHPTVPRPPLAAPDVTMRVQDVDRLVCPETKAPLVYRGSNVESRLTDGVLVCPSQREAWAVRDGIPAMVRPMWRVGADAAVADQSDAIPAWLDPLQAATTLLAGGGRIADLRHHTVQRLELGRLAGRGHARVLEVGIGTAGNLEPILDHSPAGTVVDLWGTDLSIGALYRARARVEREPRWVDRLSLVMADPCHLPFADGVFDRVLVFGGFDCFRDPGRAMAELVRVSRNDAWIVIVDKQPAQTDGPSALGRFVLRKVGRHAVSPQQAPLHLLPKGAWDVDCAQVTPVHYSLRFRPPGRR